MVSRLRYIAIWILLVLPSGSVSGQEVMEQVMFCRTDGRIVTDSCDMRLTAEWRDRIIADFLKYAGNAGGYKMDRLLRQLLWRDDG